MVMVLLSYFSKYQAWRTDRRTYDHMTTKSFETDGLPNFLSMRLHLHLARRSSAITNRIRIPGTGPELTYNEDSCKGIPLREYHYHLHYRKYKYGLFAAGFNTQGLKITEENAPPL